jgi:competence protein ComEC
VVRTAAVSTNSESPRKGTTTNLPRLGRSPLGMAFLAVASGICASRFGLPAICLWIAAWLASSMATVAYFRNATKVTAVCLWISLVGLGGIWHHQWWNLYPADHLARSITGDPAPVCARIRVLDTPRQADDFRRSENRDAAKKLTRCMVSVDQVRDRDHWRTVSGQAQLRVQGSLDHVAPGDSCEVFATMYPPSESLVPASPSAATFLRPKRLLFSLHAEHPQAITRIRQSSRWNPVWWIPRLRQACSQQIERFIPERHRELALALLLGIRDNLDRELVDTFLVTGTVHLLSISGLHVGILAMAVVWLMRWITQNERWTLSVTVATTLIYAMLAGGGAPIVRATILVMVFSLAVILRQPRQSLNSLAAAGLIVLALNPTQLFDVGAQLSFLAVATIAVATSLRSTKPQRDPLERLIVSHDSKSMSFLRWSWRQLQHGTWIGLLIWVVSLPLVMCHFHVISWISALLNLLLGLPFALAMIMGFLMLVLGWILPPFGYVAGWSVGAALDVIIWVAKGGEEVYLSHQWIAGPTLFSVGIFYGLLGLGFIFFRHLREWGIGLATAYVAMTAVWILPQAWSSAPLRRDQGKNLECTILAVGHGGCIVIDFPQGERLVYDAGGLGDPRSLANVISRFLWSRPTNAIQSLVISHADWDHCSAISHLMQRFSIQNVWVPPSMWYHQEPAVRSLCSLLEQHAGQFRCAVLGDAIISHSPPKVRVLSPNPRQRFANDNSSSIVLLVEHLGHRILLMGDLEADGVKELAKREPIDVDVLVAPHHGSLGSNPDTLCSWCKPEWIVISGSRGASQRTIENYHHSQARVLHTAIDGTVSIAVGHDGTRITTHAQR